MGVKGGGFTSREAVYNKVTAEEMALDEEKARELEKIPAEVTEAVFKHIHRLRDDDAFRDADGQCMQRFGMSWEQVRKKMDEKISSGLELVPQGMGEGYGVVIDPEALIKLVKGHTGNWMTNQFLEVLYLKYLKSDRRKSSAVKHAIKSPEIKSILNGEGISSETLWTLLDAAQSLLPEEVENVLKSHHLESQIGHRNKASKSYTGKDGKWVHEEYEE